MATLIGDIGAQTAVVFVVAVVGAIPVLLYYEKTYRLFVYAYACLFVAAFATNFENLFLPDVLNLIEHVVGNLGAGVTLAVAAYLYRRDHIVPETDETVLEEV